MNKIEKQREHFDGIADRYYKARQGKNHLHFKHLLWKYFFRGIDWKKKRTLVLEPMCGYSEGLKILRKNLNTEIIYEGFDYSQPLIDEVKKNNPKIKIYKQDVTKFKTNNKYDIIIIIGGLHHVYSHTNIILNNLRNCLSKEGYMIIFEPTQNNFLLRFIRDKIYRKNEIFDSDTEKAFDLCALNESFRKNKLKIEKQIYPGLLGYILYYNPDAFPLLNIGGRLFVEIIFNVDKYFYRNFIGKCWSFATMTLLKREE